MVTNSHSGRSRSNGWRISVGARSYRARSSAAPPSRPSAGGGPGRSRGPRPTPGGPNGSSAGDDTLTESRHRARWRGPCGRGTPPVRWSVEQRQVGERRGQLRVALELPHEGLEAAHAGRRSWTDCGATMREANQRSRVVAAPERDQSPSDAGHSAPAATASTVPSADAGSDIARVVHPDVESGP